MAKLRRKQGRKTTVPPVDYPHSKAQMALRLGVTDRTVENWQRKLGLPFVRLHERRNVYFWADVERWLRTRQVTLVMEPDGGAL